MTLVQECYRVKLSIIYCICDLAMPAIQRASALLLLCATAAQDTAIVTLSFDDRELPLRFAVGENETAARRASSLAEQATVAVARHALTTRGAAAVQCTKSGEEAARMPDVRWSSGSPVGRGARPSL